MTTTTWNTNLGDGDYTTSGNWTDGVPDETKSGVITGSGAITLPGSISLGSLSFSGYSGAVTFGSGACEVLLYLGDMTFSSGMTFVDAVKRINVRYQTSGSLTSAGQTVGIIRVEAAASTVTLLDNARTYECVVFGVGSTLAIGTYSCTVVPEGSTPGLIYLSDASITYSSGGTLVFAGAGIGSEFDVETLTTLPPTQITGAGPVINDGFEVIFASLTIQDASIGAGVWTVIGAAVATNATFTDSDFSGGSAVTCTGCTDGGGNTGVTFATPSAAGRHLAASLRRRPRPHKGKRNKPKASPPAKPAVVAPPPVDPMRHLADMLAALVDAQARAGNEPPSQPTLPGVILAPMDALQRELPENQ